MEKQPITIYLSNTFGISKTEAILNTITDTPYAQYNNSVSVTFTPKGKRSLRGFRTCKNGCEYVVILKGHGHPDPEDAFGKPKTNASTGVTITESRHLSFSDDYKTELDPVIDKLKAESPEVFLVDCRKTKQTWEVTTVVKGTEPVPVPAMVTGW